MMIRNFDICNIVDCTMKVWEGLCRNAVLESIETMSPPRDDELQPRLGCKCYQPVWWGPGQRQVHTAATAAFHGTDQEKGQKTGQI